MVQIRSSVVLRESTFFMHKNRKRLELASNSGMLTACKVIRIASSVKLELNEVTL